MFRRLRPRTGRDWPCRDPAWRTDWARRQRTGDRTPPSCSSTWTFWPTFALLSSAARFPANESLHYVNVQVQSTPSKRFLRLIKGPKKTNPSSHIMDWYLCHIHKLIQWDSWISKSGRWKKQEMFIQHNKWVKKKRFFFSLNKIKPKQTFLIFI